MTLANIGYTVCLPVPCTAQNVYCVLTGTLYCSKCILCAYRYFVLLKIYTVCLPVLCTAQNVLNCVWSARRKREFWKIRKLGRVRFELGRKSHCDRII
jgi:hypothetical protein